MKKSISTEQTPDTISRVLELLRQAPDRLESLCAGLSDEAIMRPLGPGRRSVAEIVAHLINTEARSNEAIVLALALNGPQLPGVHAERHYGVLMRHDRMSLADNLAYFRYRRTSLLRLLESLTEKQWARVMREEGKQRQESVYWRARTMALHEAEHLDEIASRV